MAGPAAREDLPEGTVVPPLKLGDSVMCVTRFGAYATSVNVPVHQARPLPAGWSFAEGAGFLVQGLTAFYALKALGGVRAGHTVLVHSAAGGCGLFGLGICQVRPELLHTDVTSLVNRPTYRASSCLGN